MSEYVHFHCWVSPCVSDECLCGACTYDEDVVNVSSYEEVMRLLRGAVACLDCEDDPLVLSADINIDSARTIDGGELQLRVSIHPLPSFHTVLLPGPMLAPGENRSIIADLCHWYPLSTKQLSTRLQ